MKSGIPELPHAIDLEKLATPRTIMLICLDWYDEWMAENINAGAEAWQTFYSKSYLLPEIRRRWVDKTGYPQEFFPWRKRFIEHVTLKVRKMTEERKAKYRKNGSLFTR